MVYLRGKVSDTIGQVASPEWQDTFASECLHGTIDDTVVGLGDDALLQHLSLILHEQFDTFDRCSSCFGNNGGNTTEREILEKAQFWFIFLEKPIGTVGSREVREQRLTVAIALVYYDGLEETTDVHVVRTALDKLLSLYLLFLDRKSVV